MKQVSHIYLSNRTLICCCGNASLLTAFCGCSSMHGHGVFFLILLMIGARNSNPTVHIVVLNKIQIAMCLFINAKQKPTTSHDFLRGHRLLLLDHNHVIMNSIPVVDFLRCSSGFVCLLLMREAKNTDCHHPYSVVTL